jgi:hypothetical protein
MSAAGRYTMGEPWVYQYYDVTALAGRLLGARRDYR